jgi:hypothetical protein
VSDRWEVHGAPYGGIWFVLQRDSELEVIAPPGIRITLGEGGDPSVPGLLPGWRRVTLPDDDDLDPQAIDAADAVCVSTRYVLERLGPESAFEIKRIMIAQLSIAVALDQTGAGLVDDSHAPASSSASSWALGELRDAFPDELWEFARELMYAECVPHFSEDLLRRTRTTDVETKPMRSASASVSAQAPSIRARV